MTPSLGLWREPTQQEEKWESLELELEWIQQEVSREFQSESIRVKSACPSVQVQ
jgi:hypothetical protein